MSNGIRLFRGSFGRALLLEIDRGLVAHAHHHCHILLKAAGPDVSFIVQNRICTVTDSTVLLLNAWEPHTYLHQEDPNSRASTILLALHIEPKWLEDGELSFAHGGHRRLFPEPIAPIPQLVRRLADDVISDLWWSDVLDQQRLAASLFNLIATIISPIAEKSRRVGRPAHSIGQPVDRRIRKALEFIQGKPPSDYGMAELAKVCNLSRTHFFTLFREQMHVTPNMYTNCVKMERAFDRLAESECSISDLAFDLGFSAQSHFTRFFTQHQGVTPTEFRRKIQDLG